MKKYLPIILVLVGIGVLTGAAIFFLRGRGTTQTTQEETLLKEVSIEKRPVARLVPGEDGHWLKLVVEKFEIDAASMDYELLYKLPDGRTQGVPGTIDLDGKDSIERDLLLGSESSGKFRYDEGVENGTLTLRFRNDQGKLVTRFETDFRLLSDTSELSTVDGNFQLELEDTPTGAFFVVMETFGILGDTPGEVVSGPYGVFASEEVSLAGSVEVSEGDIYRWDGSSWTDDIGDDMLSPGIFIGVSE